MEKPQYERIVARPSEREQAKNEIEREQQRQCERNANAGIVTQNTIAPGQTLTRTRKR